MTTAPTIASKRYGRTIAALNRPTKTKKRMWSVRGLISAMTLIKQTCGGLSKIMNSGWTTSVSART